MKVKSLNSPKASPKKSETPVKTSGGITCFDCGVNIPFIYYKCSVRENYCMCTACYEMKPQPYTVYVRYVEYEAQDVNLLELESIPEDEVVDPVMLSPAETITQPSTRRNSVGSIYDCIVHPGVTCDKCGQFPVTGLRYKCTVRDDFDLCATCFGTDFQPHPMLVLTTPIDYTQLVESGVEVVAERETQTETTETNDGQTETDGVTLTGEGCVGTQTVNEDESVELKEEQENIEVETGDVANVEDDGSRISFLKGCFGGFGDSWVTSMLEPAEVMASGNSITCTVAPVVAHEVDDNDVDDIYSDYYMIDDMLMQGGNTPSSTISHMEGSHYKPDDVEVNEEVIKPAVAPPAPVVDVPNSPTLTDSFDVVSPLPVETVSAPLIDVTEEVLEEAVVSNVPVVDEEIPAIILWHRQLLVLSEMGFKDTNECIELLQEHIGSPSDNIQEERMVTGMQRVVARLLMRTF